MSDSPPPPGGHPSPAPFTLPVDPDVERAGSALRGARPIHVRPVSLALVFTGGALGTAAREALTLAFPPVHGIQFTVFAINIVGAFLLGLLLSSLAHHGPDLGQRRSMRLLLGTGVMGGFTTYSALTANSASLISDGASAIGILYALGTLILGAGATWVGIALAGARQRSANKEGR